MENNNLSPSHYARWKIEPWDFIAANNLDFMRGNVIKYIMRYDAKNGIEDLQKAKVYLEKLISENTVPIQAEYKGEPRYEPPEYVCQEKTVVFSTANITEDDGDFLSIAAWKADNSCGNPHILRVEGGWLVQIDRGSDKLGDSMPKRMSTAFINIILKAQKWGVDYVRFDRDAGPVPGFAIFNW